MKMRLSVLALALLAGCSSNPKSDRGIEPVPVSAEERLAMARAGQSVVFEGYVYNGVIVTPQRNFYYGQTDGLQHSETVQGDCFISDISAEEGGERTHECPPIAAPVPVAVEERPAATPLEMGEAAAPVPLAEVSPAPKAAAASMNPFYDELMAHTLKLDPNSQSDLMKRTISFANAPIPRFAAGRSELSAGDRERLQRFGAELSNLGEQVVVLVAGYTSQEGPADLNNSLAKGRASVVRKVLVESGAASDFTVAFATPQCCYLNGNRTPAERALNRRVEITQGGQYADSGGLVPQRIAIAIARIRKHVGENPGTRLRVHVQAPTMQLAAKVESDVRSVMGDPAVGLTFVQAGVVSAGDRENVIIEVTK